MENFKLKEVARQLPYFLQKGERKDVQELRIYSVSDAYISFLRQKVSEVYASKEDSRRHTRKYVGVVIKVSGYNYYIPMSSPKSTDYQIAGKDKVIKKSIVPIVRLVEKNSEGQKELKGTLRVSHMIPVPEQELEVYDLDGEQDTEYKKLVQIQAILIRKNRKKIIDSANLLYKQKRAKDPSAGYVSTALDYEYLEQLCKEYMSNTSQRI